MRMPPLPADSIHARACKLKCEKILTRPLPKSQPLRWVVIWDRRSAAFFDFAEISVLTVICIKITTPFGVVIFMHTVRTSHTRRK